MKQIKWYVWVILCCWSCRTAEEGTCLTFGVDIQPSGPAEVFNRYYELEEAIPLETKDSVLLGDLTKVVKAGERLFVLDGNRKTIYEFSRKGKFLNKISRIGKGPGEYVSVTDFAVTKEPQQVIVYDRSGKLNYYDWEGNFLREQKADRNISHLVRLPNGEWLTNHGLMQTPGPQDTNFIIRVAGADMEYKNGVEALPKLTYSVPIQILSPFYDQGDRYYVIPLTQNTVYEYVWKKGAFVPRYRFNIRNYPAPVVTRLTDQDMLKGFYLGYYMLTGEYVGKQTVLLMASLLKKGEMQLLLADKKSREVYFLPVNVEDRENELSLKRYFHQSGFGGQLVFYTTALAVTGKEYNDTSSAGYRLSRQVKEEDNAVLLLYQEK